MSISANHNLWVKLALFLALIFQGAFATGIYSAAATTEALSQNDAIMALASHADHEHGANGSCAPASNDEPQCLDPSRTACGSCLGTVTGGGFLFTPVVTAYYRSVGINGDSTTTTLPWHPPKSRIPA